MLKKLTAALLSVAFALGIFAACGKNSDSSTSGMVKLIESSSEQTTQENPTSANTAITTTAKTAAITTTEPTTTKPTTATSAITKPITTTKQQQTNIKVGQRITFGAYQWYVLDVQNGKALLITKDIIEMRAYNEGSYGAIIWEDCTLRKWLNSEFYNSFSAADRAKILSTTVENYERFTGGKYNTIDKIFLLSFDEAQTYFSLKENRVAMINFSSQKQIEEVAKKMFVNGSYPYYDTYEEFLNYLNELQGKNGDWWLRSTGNLAGTASYVSFIGSTFINGNPVDIEGGIRPVLWLNIAS
jgi:hypothetical protein